MDQIFYNPTYRLIAWFWYFVVTDRFSPLPSGEVPRAFYCYNTVKTVMTSIQYRVSVLGVSLLTFPLLLLLIPQPSPFFSFLAKLTDCIHNLQKIRIFLSYWYLLNYMPIILLITALPNHPVDNWYNVENTVSKFGSISLSVHLFMGDNLLISYNRSRVNLSKISRIVIWKTCLYY